MRRELKRTYFMEENFLNDSNKSNALEMTIYYDEGGMNYFNGNIDKRGYNLAIRPIRQMNGFVEFTIFDSKAVRFFIEETKRFSAKRMEKLWNVFSQKFDLYKEWFITGNKSAIFTDIQNNLMSL